MNKIQRLIINANFDLERVLVECLREDATQEDMELGCALLDAAMESIRNARNRLAKKCEE